MPTITIQITPQEKEKRAEIAKVFTDELFRITGIPKEVTVVFFQEIPDENIARNGQLLSEHTDE